MQKSNKHEQIQAIKQRLNDALDRSKLNINQLTDAINESNDIEVNYGTVRNVLDRKKDAIDLTTVIAICRYLHLDTAMVLSRPGTKDTTYQSNGSFLDSGNFTVLDDPKYFGKFHGFFYSPNHKSPELIRFELEIIKKNGQTTATMYYHGRPTSVEGKPYTDPRILYGTPYVDARHSTIFLLLANETGDFYFLYFNWQHFRSHGLYFRRGIALTPSSLRDNPVLFTNFVLFALPVDDADIPYVSGLLAEVYPVFWISQEKANQLRAKEPLVETFFQTFGYILEHEKQPMYTINETQILNTSNSHMEEMDVIKAMLLLFFASTFSSKMQIEFLKVAWGISPVLHFLRRHSFRCRRGAVAGIQSLLVTDM